MKSTVFKFSIALFCIAQSNAWGIGRVWNSSGNPIVFSFAAAGCFGMAPWNGPSAFQCHWGLLGASHSTPISYDTKGKYQNGHDDKNNYWWEDYSYTVGSSDRHINIGAWNSVRGAYDFCGGECSYPEGNINITSVKVDTSKMINNQDGYCTMKCEYTNF